MQFTLDLSKEELVMLKETVKSLGMDKKAAVMLQFKINEILAECYINTLLEKDDVVKVSK